MEAIGEWGRSRFSTERGGENGYRKRRRRRRRRAHKKERKKLKERAPCVGFPNTEREKERYTRRERIR